MSPESYKALYGISQGKGFGFIVCPAGAIVAAGSKDLPLAVVQDHKYTSPMSILRSSIELEMNVGALDKSSSDW